MKKSFKTLVSVVIVSVIATTVFGVTEAAKKINVNSDTFNLESVSSDFTEAVNNQSVLSVSQAVKSVITEAFKENGIKNAEVSVTADISDDCRIYISEVTVLCDASQTEKAISVLDKLSIKAQVKER